MANDSNRLKYLCIFTLEKGKYYRTVKIKADNEEEGKAKMKLKLRSHYPGYRIGSMKLISMKRDDY